MMESPATPMDIVSTQIYHKSPLMNADGGIDVDAYRQYIDAVLHRIPRYRQKLRWIPYADIPVWVDDPEFDIEYHIRHTALPRPGTREQLKKLTARILERALDRERPLWELWLVEGLEDQRYAIISKVHHCMLAGIDGLSLGHVLLSDNSDERPPKAPPFMPGKAPSEVSLLWDEWNRRYSQPIDALRNAGELLRRPRAGIDELEKRFGAVKNSLGCMIRRPPDTPINGDLCTHRRVEWLDLPLQPLVDTSAKLDCTLNDMLLCLLAGGLHKLFAARQFELKRSELRLAVPVSGKEGASTGIATGVLGLPVDEADPVLRIERIRQASAVLKAGNQPALPNLLVDVSERMPAGLLELFSASKSACVNTLASGVAGSPVPRFSLGAELEATYTHLPLLPGIGLATALMSYNGRIFWAFDGDYNLLPDLDLMKQGVLESFSLLTGSTAGGKCRSSVGGTKRGLGKKAVRKRSTAQGRAASKRD
jgi:WS/DGAT/MGAT family acyltransferase